MVNISVPKISVYHPDCHVTGHPSIVYLNFGNLNIQICVNDKIGLYDVVYVIQIVNDHMSMPMVWLAVITLCSSMQSLEFLTELEL